MSEQATPASRPACRSRPSLPRARVVASVFALLALACGGGDEVAEHVSVRRAVEGEPHPYDEPLPVGVSVELTAKGPPEYLLGRPIFPAAPSKVVVGIRDAHVVDGAGLVSEPQVELGIAVQLETLAPGTVTLELATERGRHTEVLVIR